MTSSFKPPWYKMTGSVTVTPIRLASILMTVMSRSVVFPLIVILVSSVMEVSNARKSDKGSNIIIISPPAPNPDPQPPPSPYMIPQPQFQIPPPTFPPLSLPYPIPVPSISNFIHRSGLLPPPSLPPPMPPMNREFLRNLFASSSMNMPLDYQMNSMNDMAMESSTNSENFMSFIDPQQKMLQALLPNFLVLPWVSKLYLCSM